MLKKSYVHKHRGLVGVEATIIVIALVIVAAALAFVVLNMGFSTSQQAKTTISSTLSATSGSLVVEGKVTATSYQPAGGTSSLNVTSIPIKISSSDNSVNLDPSVTAVKYLSNQITYDDIYNGTLNAKAKPTYTSIEAATNAAATYDTAVGGKLVSRSPFQGGTDADTNDWPDETTAFIHWTVQSNTNDHLENGEHANLVVVFAATDRPQYLDKIRVEIIQADGASLTVDRVVPLIHNQVVDLG